jgi:hypothetical protein
MRGVLEAAAGAITGAEAVVVVAQEVLAASTSPAEQTAKTSCSTRHSWNMFPSARDPSPQDVLWQSGNTKCRAEQHMIDELSVSTHPHLAEQSAVNRSSECNNEIHQHRKGHLLSGTTKQLLPSGLLLSCM